jgi:hypothetical protein
MQASCSVAIHVRTHETLLVLRDPFRLRKYVELADLRVALQHLHRLRVVGHGEGLRGDDAAAAEGLGREALRAALEVDDGRWSPFFESAHTTQTASKRVSETSKRDVGQRAWFDPASARDALLRRHGHVQRKLWRYYKEVGLRTTQVERG